MFGQFLHQMRMQQTFALLVGIAKMIIFRMHRYVWLNINKLGSAAHMLISWLLYHVAML